LVPFYQIEIPRKLSVPMGTICLNLTTRGWLDDRECYDENNITGASGGIPISALLSNSRPARASAVLFKVPRGYLGLFDHKLNLVASIRMLVGAPIVIEPQIVIAKMANTVGIWV
jgi:hypothetical protein